jgi:hypothetical protein
MPRYVFTPAAVTSTGTPQRIQVWDRAVGGRRLFDLYTIDGSDNTLLGITQGTIVTDSVGNITPFVGPADITTVFLHVFGAGSRTAQTFARIAQSESRAAKPVVTGSKAANAALTSLIAALVAQGIITDTTT